MLGLLLTMGLSSCPTSSVDSAPPIAQKVVQQLPTAEEVRGWATLAEAGEVEPVRRHLASSAGAIGELTAAAREGELELLRELDALAKKVTERQAQLAFRSRILAILEQRLPEDHLDVLRACIDLSRTRYALGDLEGTLALELRVVETLERTRAEEDPGLLQARADLAGTLLGLGRIQEALEVQTQVLEVRERILPEDDPKLLSTRQVLALALRRSGDLPRAREILEEVVATCERTLPEDSTRLIDAKMNLGVVLTSLEDNESALAIFEEVQDSYRRTLPANHIKQFLITVNIAAVQSQLGDHRSALFGLERAVKLGEELLPKDHPQLLAARMNLAGVSNQLGDLEGSRAVFEEVLRTYERLVPEDNDRLLATRMNLAVTLLDLGDFPRAVALLESVLAVRERSLPEDHPSLLNVRTNLAQARRSQGDLEGALALQRSVLEGRERTLPADHLGLLGARLNLATTMVELGRIEGAREIFEAVIAARERAAAVDDLTLITARWNFASLQCQCGDHEGALPQFEGVLAAYERFLSAEHPTVQEVKLNLAAARFEVGDLRGAEVLQREVLAQREVVLSAGHRQLLEVQAGLHKVRRAQGGEEEAKTLLNALLEGMLIRLESALGLAPREAREVAGSEGERLDELLLFFAEERPPDELVTLIETRRHVVTLGSALGHPGDDPERAALRREVTFARSTLNDLVLGGPTAGEEIAWRNRIERVSRERDQHLRELRSRLREEGALVDLVEPGMIARALPESGFAIGYLRHGLPTGGDRFLALLIPAAGAPRRLDLGPAKEIERLIDAWREALGKPLQRGVAIAEDELDELELGRALREAVLDPVLAAAGTHEAGVVLHVCLDDVLHLVPFDALPLDEGERRLLDLHLVHVEASFARLVAAPAALSGEGLLAVGDVDFDAELSDEERPEQAAATTPVEAATDRGPFAPWPRLWGTVGELQAIAGQFEAAKGSEPVQLSRGEATKAALFELAPGKRYVHLATHGWFAPESILSVRDFRARGSGAGLVGPERTIVGLAPMTLCGLCLAGANRGRDRHGRVPGMLTAEELCAADLRACELAVLSACETNVGLRRAGRGILSLQAALHSAGARCAVTSLWRVDDALTRELMTGFYQGLWEEGLGKAEALRAAKRRLRDQGYPLSAWAGWVLTGDPE